jgi:hypothetical protein
VVDQANDVAIDPDGAAKQRPIVADHGPGRSVKSAKNLDKTRGIAGGLHKLLHQLGLLHRIHIMPFPSSV